MIFAEMITLYREKKGISLRKLANQLDIQFPTLYKIEQGCLPTSKHLIKLLVWVLSEPKDK